MRQSLAHPDPQLKLPVQQLTRLDPEKVEYIFVHTAAFSGRNCDAALIDRWHREREVPFLCIGYHRVVLNGRHDRLPDGYVQEGRPLDRVGAHVQGVNGISVGICVVGDGDTEEFTPAQMRSLVQEIAFLMERFPKVTVDHVLGHHEVNQLVAAGKVPAAFRTTKSCPGRRIDMNAVRSAVLGEWLTEVVPAVIQASVPAAAPEPTRAPVKMPVAQLYTHRRVDPWEVDEEIRQSVIEQHPDVQQPEGLTLRRAWVIVRDIVTAVDRWARVDGEATGADKMEIAIRVIVSLLEPWGGLAALRRRAVDKLDEKPLGMVTSWAAGKLLTDRVIERALRWIVELAVAEIRELGGGTRRK